MYKWLFLVVLFGFGANVSAESSLKTHLFKSEKVQFTKSLKSFSGNMPNRINGVSSTTRRDLIKNHSEKKELRENSEKNRRNRNEKEDDDRDDEDEQTRGTLPPIVTPPVVTPPVITPPVVTPPPVVPTVNSFTLAQVSTHNTAASCYSVVSGGVYNLTSWIAQHPGGQSVIKAMCGIDATSAFLAQHGGQGNPAAELAAFKIGVLVN